MFNSKQILYLRLHWETILIGIIGDKRNARSSNFAQFYIEPQKGQMVHVFVTWHFLYKRVLCYVCRSYNFAFQNMPGFKVTFVMRT